MSTPDSQLKPSSTVPDAKVIVEAYLKRVEQTFKAKDLEAIEALFLPNGYLREYVCISPYLFICEPRISNLGDGLTHW